MNRNDRTFLLWRFTQHDLHILVTALFCCDRKRPSGMCAKLRTVAASNNRVHPTRSLSSSPLASTINCSLASQALLEATHQNHSIIACSRHIYICCSSHIFRSWWTTYSAQRQRSGCNRRQHSRYKAILLSIVLSQQCCEVYFIIHTVVNP